ncbi:spindle assembly abnormal protein 6 homolog isoform X2 [Pieris rapae]|uniref:spindle assembly abnormal protein 6 homolog isoform X2 n=1 Tax=Pieris rapae TaxID=64459 RepID=UPI001E280365|nr:spindle assembly abnormal protein 6 homolog isoform X2 [Pieris rapae]
MFASLKSKIKEETGSDISKLTSSWRSGAFLGRLSLRDDSSTTSPSSSGGQGDTTSDSISPQLQTYLNDRTGGQVDQVALHQQYTTQLEEKLKDRDLFWEHKIEELKLSLASVQGEEASAAQNVARTAQAEAAKAMLERDQSQRHLNDLKARLAAAENAQDRLDTLNEELEESRRAWTRERAELTAALSAADARTRDLVDELQVLRAALPTTHPEHHIHDDDKDMHLTGCGDYDRVCREKAVLTRQLQEAKMVLADVKTSWSAQIASLETQVARLSRQAGEEGAERRRVENEKRDIQENLLELSADLEKARQNLANSEAKDKTMELETQIQELTAENKELSDMLEDSREMVTMLREKLEESRKICDEQKEEVNHLNSVMTDMQHDYIDIQRKFDKERREKDEALLRNAHISQSVEKSLCNVRFLESETTDLKSKITELEGIISQHKENQASCMLIKENEEARNKEIEELRQRIKIFTETEDAFKKTIQDLEAEICDRNKKIKTLDNRISDMKKILQREVQSSKSDLTTAEEQDISRRYLKHVVLRFLTARELEARQLTRALSVLLRLSAHEEALLRAALPARSGISAWFPALTP